MRIQTLHKQGMGAKAIKSAYPDKNSSLTSIKRLCKMLDTTGSVLDRWTKRSKTARTMENIARVEEMICSQEGQPGTSRSTREIAQELSISQTSVMQIAKVDIGLSSFKRIPVQVISEATRLKRLQRSKQLLRRLTLKRIKSVFFTDEKIFYISPPVNTQNNRVCSSGRKRDVRQERLLVQRAKFSAHVMVSAGVCYGGKGKLHFVDDKAKINTHYYVNNLLPKLFNDCNALLANQFIFQQDGAPAHSSRQTQDWISQHSPDFIRKDEWPPNSPDLNPLDYHVWGAMLHMYQKLSPKPANREQLKLALEKIWDELPQDSIKKAVLAFRKRLRACVAADGKHFENLLC